MDATQISIHGYPWINKMWYIYNENNTKNGNPMTGMQERYTAPQGFGQG